MDINRKISAEEAEELTKDLDPIITLFLYADLRPATLGEWQEFIGKVKEIEEKIGGIK